MVVRSPNTSRRLHFVIFDYIFQGVYMFITKIAIETMGKHHEMNIFVLDKCTDSKHTVVGHITHTNFVLYCQTPKILCFSCLSLCPMSSSESRKLTR